MKSDEIREQFLRFFEKKGHKILPGSSLVPKDPTVLLTLAGMLQFKPIFLGQEKPKHKNAATVQKCLRTNDIENVGKTARHHTFFEMLGNFSFGGYFKREAIEYAWELLTKVYKLPVDRLSAAVYEKDDEAVLLWREVIGLPENKIFRLDEDNNFWAVGPTGPCGPCSEIYYDQGEAMGCGKPDCQPGCDCDRFLEVWNLVFIQYNRDDQGELVPLKSKGIDTGMGLERLASVMQGVDSNFETDLFVPLIKKIKAEAKEKDQAKAKISLRIIADHVRAATHLISDGVLPDNTGRGYILRRLIRRAVRHGKLLGLNKPFLYKLSEKVIAQMKDVYPVLCQKDKLVYQVLKAEEENFLATLEQGMNLFGSVMAKHKPDKLIPGETVFKLHDTFGFPIELSREIAAEAGFRLDEAGFDKAMEQQKDRAREAGISTEKKKLLGLDLDKFGATKFTGYEKNIEETRVQAVFSQQRFVILDHTPFYGASGGQVGDTGLLKIGSKDVKVTDTLRTPHGTIVHEVEELDGLKENHKVTATIDASKREATQNHHTATHLLHKALREILGDHVKQSGSQVGPDKLRFDFSHFQAMTHDQLQQVEARVNEQIKQKIKVDVLQKSYKDAIKMGAMALFNEKYGDKVRVLRIGDYSLELCGGTHVSNTGDILFFKIMHESALGSGVRRIEAVAGQAAKVYTVYKTKSLNDENDDLLRKFRLMQIDVEKLGGNKSTETGIFNVATAELDSLLKAIDEQDSLKVNKILDHLSGRVAWLRERIAKTEKGINNLKLKSAQSDAVNYLDEMKTMGEIKVLTKEFKEYSMDMLRSISDTVQNQAKSCVLVLAASFPGRLRFLITVTPDLVANGVSAKKIAAVFGPIVQGQGGGRDNKVEGGGKDPARIAEAFEKVCASLA